MYKIQDWAGNEMFNGERFLGFDEADEFLGEFLGRIADEQGEDFDEMRGEYYIVPVGA